MNALLLKRLAGLVAFAAALAWVVPGEILAIILGVGLVAAVVLLRHHFS